MKMHKLSPKDEERAFLVGLVQDKTPVWQVEESIDELQELAMSAGARVMGRAIQQLPHPTAAHYIGKGKAEEVARLCKEHKVDTVIFDDDLTPAQGRNLSELFKIKVIDRTELILDIFAQRARTREGMLQIELAQLKYLLPRLKRMWLHLSRQAGGIGGRGPGETQLEVDRRRIQEKIARLTRELDEVRQHRAVQRGARQKAHVPVVSFVGYTNVGKSTLMNRLTDAGVLAVNQLFATLDPTTRQVTLPGHHKILLTDTVGFLKKLPTHLVESFKATLEEIKLADALLHVVDISHPHFELQIEAVNETLRQIEAWGKPTVMVFNKVDRVEGSGVFERMKDQYTPCVFVSALSGEGMEDLLEQVERLVKSWRDNVHLKIPLAESALVAEIHRLGHVVSSRYTSRHVILEARIPKTLSRKLDPYVQPAG